MFFSGDRKIRLYSDKMEQGIPEPERRNYQ